MHLHGKAKDKELSYNSEPMKPELADSFGSWESWSLKPSLRPGLLHWIVIRQLKGIVLQVN